MRLHRFYIEEKLRDLPAGRQVQIFDEAILHQMKNVFRLEVGDKVIFFDGQEKERGKDYECNIELLSKKEGKFIVEKINENFIPERKVTLYISLIKKENFELTIEKATELGVSKIVPIITERVQKKNIDLDRCRRIIKEASEQCGRGDLPEIIEPMNLEEIFTEDVSNLIAFDMSGENFKTYQLINLPRRQAGLKTYQLLIGPEGGWSDEELNIFKDKKIKMYSLGNTVLRAETAAIVASAFVLN